MIGTRLVVRWTIYVILLILHIVGFLLFLKGFFPSKVVLPGFNEYGGVSPFLEEDKPHFSKIVLMVVDAMRSDFLYSESYSSMSFVHKLINDGNAIPFTAYSNPPTVTLPRLKGITTGGTPNFLDAILNVADDKDSSQGMSNQDSWIYQFTKKKGKRINFYGDDTWLKLFPSDEFFEKVDGTSSFFVSDFTEVDNNVTRHLDEDLSDSRWDGLILHYLGLDHIGHKGGPESVFMKPKQKEMDSIIERIYNYTSNSDTLFVVMGDHGMNEIGNHGGSTIGETSAGLLFISPKFQKLHNNYKAPVPNSDDYSYFDRVSQIDLVPTLACLLDFPIPRNNLGIIISNFLDLWTSNESKIKILKQNCDQFMNLVTAKYGALIDEALLHKWNELSNCEDIEPYYGFLASVQSLLASSATNYNYSDIWKGYIFLVCSAIITLSLFNWYFLKESNINKRLIIFFELFTIIYSLHFHGSSLIEEEHQIWWFFSVTSIVFLFIYNNFKSFPYFLLITMGARLIRAWCNSGQKYSTPYTFSSFLLKNNNLLWFLNILTYIQLAISIYCQGGLICCFSLNDSKTMNLRDFGSLITFIVSFVSCSISYSFKICQFYNDGNSLPKWLNWLLVWICNSFGITLDLTDKNQLQDMNIQLSQLAFYCFIGLLATRIVIGKLKNVTFGLLTDIINIVTLFLVHQSRAENIPLFIIFYLIKYSFAKILQNNKAVLRNNVDQLIIIVSAFILCIQNLSFLSIGNTNSLATVDLSNAYNGVKSYDVIFVGILTFFSTFASPIYWSLASLQIMFEDSIILFDPFNQPGAYINFPILKRSIFLIKSLVSLTFYSIAAVNLIGSCINLRFHLFIWTVFSPKLLYFGSWSVLVNTLIDFILAVVLLWLC